MKSLILYVYVLQADFYCTHNGRKLGIDDGLPPGNIIQITPKLLGGKGGFGSMLRAIGAQIEKTTNREACRDLSGRRLRDINEEKRFINYYIFLAAIIIFCLKWSFMLTAYNILLTIPLYTLLNQVNKRKVCIINLLFSMNFPG